MFCAYKRPRHYPQFYYSCDSKGTIVIFFSYDDLLVWDSNPWSWPTLPLPKLPFLDQTYLAMTKRRWQTAFSALRFLIRAFLNSLSDCSLKKEYIFRLERFIPKYKNENGRRIRIFAKHIYYVFVFDKQLSWEI